MIPYCVCCRMLFITLRRNIPLSGVGLRHFSMTLKTMSVSKRSGIYLIKNVRIWLQSECKKRKKKIGPRDYDESPRFIVPGVNTRINACAFYIYYYCIFIYVLGSGDLVPKQQYGPCYMTRCIPSLYCNKVPGI